MNLHRSASHVGFVLPAILFALLACFSLYGAAHAADRILNDLYEKSGTKEELKYIAPPLLDSFDRAVNEFEPSEHPSEQIIKAARDLLASSFAAESLKDSVMAEYAANLTPEEVRAVLAWLDSPLGAKAARLEIESSTPEAEPKIQQFIAEIDKNPPPEARMNLIVQYERATALTEASTSIVIDMQLAIVVAVNALFVPPEKRKSIPEMTEALEKNRTMLEGSLRPDLLSRLLYTYRSLSDDELKRLMEFETSELGKKYTRTALTSTQKALVDATARFSKSLSQKIKESK